MTGQDTSRPSVPAHTYTLNRYILRSLLTLLGPPALLGFYCFIVVEFLIKPPGNDDIVDPNSDASWVFYVWFIAAIFALEWARAGLANIEAAALMIPQLAPKTASSLMWHTDMKWANPLWWLRAAHLSTRLGLRSIIPFNATADRGPNLLWLFLSFDSILLYLAIPLSGLTVELTTVSIPSDDQILIYGPNSTNFNARGPAQRLMRTFNYWQSGRPAAPLYGTILYAPEGTENVSMTYFDDLALDASPQVRFFAGPSVREMTAGRAFGMYADISCSPVPTRDLQLIQMRGINDHSILACVRNEEQTNCTMRWENPLDVGIGHNPFPEFFNMSDRVSPGRVNLTMVAAADGWLQDWWDSGNPYTRTSNHDNLTVNHINNATPSDQITSAMFEIFLWQGPSNDDIVPQDLLEDAAELVEVRQDRIDGDLDWWDSPFYGIGVHCDVATAIGFADLDPGRRSFSAFERTAAPEDSLGPTYGTMAPTDPPQRLAMDVLKKQTRYHDPDNALAGIWVALHNAIGASVLRPSTVSGGDLVLLTPRDLQLAMYRLLGNSVIAIMDEGGSEPFYGELYSMKQTRYITGGVISWIYVVVLLAMWTALTSGGALWLLLFGGPRWAPSLNGFEMFKFGARYTEEMEKLESVDFQSCGSSLSQIPGLIGALPGTHPGVASKAAFVGLSENVAERKATYTFDRSLAATTRYAIL